MVGGPTRMPMVQKFVEGMLGKKVERGVDPMECVALGAAVGTRSAAIGGRQLQQGPEARPRTLQRNGGDAGVRDARTGHRGLPLAGERAMRIRVVDDRHLMPTMRERVRPSLGADGIPTNGVGWVEGADDRDAHHAGLQGPSEGRARPESNRSSATSFRKLMANAASMAGESRGSCGGSW